MGTDQSLEMIISGLTYLARTRRRWKLARLAAVALLGPVVFLAATGQHDAPSDGGQGRCVLAAACPRHPDARAAPLIR